jgi:serine O-acetyltransferase
LTVPFIGVCVSVLMSLQHIKESLLRSYEEIGGINHLDGTNLPSEGSINRLASDLMHLLFPGFFQQSPARKDTLLEATGALLESVAERLRAEIEKALRSADLPEPAEQAQAHTTHLLERLPDIRAIVRTDVEAAYVGDPAARSLEEIILAYPCVLVISLQRIAHVLYRLGVPIIPRMLTEYAHERTGTDIHPGAEIGSHFFIDHCTGVVIGETTRIGHHVKIYQGVTLGAKSFELDDHGNPVKGVKRHPDIGNHVTIYPGASILGGRTVVGDHSIVGSNVWLMKSIPPDSIVYYQGEVTSVVRDKHSRSVGPTSTREKTEALDWII